MFWESFRQGINHKIQTILSVIGRTRYHKWLNLANHIFNICSYIGYRLFYLSRKVH